MSVEALVTLVVLMYVTPAIIFGYVTISSHLNERDYYDEVYSLVEYIGIIKYSKYISRSKYSVRIQYRLRSGNYHQPFSPILIKNHERTLTLVLF